MSANSLPADCNLSSDRRTSADLQSTFENANRWGKEPIPGASEVPNLSIAIAWRSQ